MKKLNFAMLAIVSTTVIYGCGSDNPEPDPFVVITQQDFSELWGDITRHSVSPFPGTPGPAGRNVSWDFSAYSSVVSTIPQEGFECPGNEGCSGFPEANRMFKHSVGGYTYYVLSDNDLITLGGTGGDGGMETYTDPQTMWEFPLEYGKTWSDSFSSIHANMAGDPFMATEGEGIWEVDGYGTLITPAGTFPNTLRIKETTTRVFTGFVNMVSTIEIYHWMNKDYEGGVLAMFMVSTSNLPGDAGSTSFAFMDANPL
ncbi:hypothetical protein ACFSKL_04510 [Belliella marina]|uniref:Uncharacterized protein n=1 Tax=Belliella marina TaxID=1644146 RepID=A0ABW4VHA8_9BACT